MMTGMHISGDFYELAAKIAICVVFFGIAIWRFVILLRIQWSLIKRLYDTSPKRRAARRNELRDKQKGI